MGTTEIVKAESVDALRAYVEGVCGKKEDKAYSLQVAGLVQDSNFQALVAGWWQSVQDRKFRQPIEEGMREVVSSVTDFDDLITMWVGIQVDVGSAQVAVTIWRQHVLPLDDDIQRVISLWLKNIACVSVPRHIVEERMREVLGEINHYDDLTRLHKSVETNSRPEQLIEDRMRLVINRITADRTPPWFTGLLRDPARIFGSTEADFNRKAVELLEVLEKE